MLKQKLGFCGVDGLDIKTVKQSGLRLTFPAPNPSSRTATETILRGGLIKNRENLASLQAKGPGVLRTMQHEH